LVWYSPEIWLVINYESLFALRFSAPISVARFIPAIRASYSALLLLALNSNLNDCTMRMSPGPSRMMPAPLPFKFEDPSTDKSHIKGVDVLDGRCELYDKVGQDLRFDAAFGNKLKIIL